MLSTLVSAVGLPLLLGVVSDALQKIDSPVTHAAANALRDVDHAMQSGLIDEKKLAEANRHIEAIAELKAREYEAALFQVNQSLRAEIATQDKYVRRMRPTFGYLMALTWAAQMFGIAYVIIFDTDKAGVIMASMGSLSAIWAVGLSVLGVYVYKRSEDKKVFPPQEVIFWNPAPPKDKTDIEKSGN